MKKTMAVNQKIREVIEREDKKPTAVADKAGIRRDIFSRIINCKRVVYADEVVPICRALGITVEEIFEESA